MTATIPPITGDDTIDSILYGVFALLVLIALFGAMGGYD